MDGWRASGPAGGRTDGMDGWVNGWMDGWMGGRAGGRMDRQTDRDRFHYGNSYHHFVWRRYTELIRPVPEDAIAEVS